MKKILLFVSIISSVQLFGQKELIDNELNSEFYSSQFTGFYLYDPFTNEELYNYNGNKFFIPASNTKIFTLYTAMKTLGDSIPAFKYQLIGEELHVEGTGDPTFLHPKYSNNNKSLNFLKNNGTKIVLHWDNFEEESFLPGWTWDDFRKDYAPERSQFPIHENLVSISKKGNIIETFPNYFKENTIIKDAIEQRDFYENKFYISKNKRKERIPFIVNKLTIESILSEVLDKTVEVSDAKFPEQFTIFYGEKTDNVYREMMESSDNFLAEHLLLLTSSTLTGKLSASETINYSKKYLLKNLKQEPQWFDGSGLSRYNLFTPQNFVQVLDKLYKEFPQNRIFSIFPIGGKTGTIKNRYKDFKEPYVFAKTGSLNNNVTLSGYIKTKSGKMLIFSLLNNNSIKDLSEIRNRNEKLLRIIRDNY